MADLNQAPVDNPADPENIDVNRIPLNLLGQFSGYWRQIADRKKRQHDINTKQIVLGQIFTIVAVAAVSVSIEQNKESLLLVGSTLILYPSLVDLLISNAAGLGASIHHDIDNQQRSKFWFTVLTTLRSIAVASLACIIVGALAGVLGSVLFEANFIATLKLAVLSGFLASLIGLPLLVAITLTTRRMSSNPDDINPPVENTVFSVLVLLVIGLASRILS